MTKIIRREPRSLNSVGTYPVVACDCGTEVHCDNSWANQCIDCGTEFNGSGQQLAPRSFWGEETGESF